jgi:hypothetical protein
MFESVLTRIAKHDFTAGVWHPESACWRCGTELGAVAAIVSRVAPAGRYRRWAISTFDTVAREHQEANGAFGPPARGDQISTGAELVSMGTAFLELEPTLTSSQHARWAAALDRAAQWLLGRLDFYINGNINLQETLGLYLAWRATGDASLLAAYDRSWSFTLAPGPRWRGFGLVYTRKSSNPLGLGGAAYLAEQGAAAPGFDPHYTILQADYAAELYALSHDQQVLRLLNLLMNQLLTRVAKGTLAIQTGGGSRHPERGVSGPFVCAALPVLAFADRSRDLVPFVMKQLSLAKVDFRNYARHNNDQDQVIGNYAAALLSMDAPTYAAASRRRS